MLLSLFNFNSPPEHFESGCTKKIEVSLLTFEALNYQGSMQKVKNSIDSVDFTACTSTRGSDSGYGPGQYTRNRTDERKKMV